MLLKEFRFESYHIRIYKSITDTDIFSEWKNFQPADSHLRPDLLMAIENSKPEDLGFRYMFIHAEHHGNKLCGIVYFQILRFNHRNFNFNNKSIGSILANFVLRYKTFRILISGNIFSVDFPSFSIDLSLLNEFHFLKILDHYRMFENHDVFIIKDLPEEYSIDKMNERGFSAISSDLTMQLDLDPEWKSFNDYEKALVHKYAQRLRKIKRKGSRLVRREISKTDFIQSSGKIMELFNQVAERQTVRTGLINSKYFENLFTVLKEDFFMTGYYLDNQLVAFASHILYKDKLEVHYIGIDYKHNQDHCLYFNILYDGITHAIHHKKASLELGRTAREAKAILGCHAIYFNDYYKVKNSLIRKLFNLLSDNFQKNSGVEWKNRHPFKKSMNILN